ncbi:glycosyltransferase family 9 protein [Longitalea arenae]|uniref:glycosyltransferase family 9 protein n=1 Tax=Longitalea arenae TaxID=2812558 RepID=UPI0019683559|nr:glycosyltransferase family 9 protein [Longitalea arenae]
MMTFTTEKPKIALLRALQLGDMLCAVPAFRALRQAFPPAEISLIGLPWAGSFVQRYNQYIDRLIVFPGYPGLPEQPFSQTAWDKFVEQMRQEQFDCIIQMQGNGTIVNEMLQQLGARQLAGFHRHDCRMDPEWFTEYPETEHEINRHLLLMQHLGIRDTNPQLEFPITDEEEESMQELVPFVHYEKYVVVHPGSRSAARQWPPCYFAAMADHCAQNGYRVVLTGTADEKYLTDYVAALMQHKAVNLAGKTNLGVVAALIKNASLLIANCTGVSHIAAGTRTPSIIISMDGEPHRWGPLNRELHHVFDWTSKKSFTEVYHQLCHLITTEQKKEIGLTKPVAIQLGAMGFVAQ